MKRFLKINYFSISLIFLFLLITVTSAFQNSPYARRLRPVVSFGACSENEIAYDMILHTAGICTNTGYKTLIDSTSSAILPSQTTHSGKFLATNGSSASWAVISSITNSAGANVLMKSNGINAVGSQISDDGTTIKLANVSIDAAGLSINNATGLFLLGTGDVGTSFNGLRGVPGGPWKLGDMDNNNNGTTLIIDDSSTEVAIAGIITGTSIIRAGNGFRMAFVGLNAFSVEAPAAKLFIGNAANNSSQITCSTCSGNHVAELPNKTGTFAFLSDISAFFSAGTPTIAGNGTLNTGSKDSAGKVTTTATGASTIVLTFSATFARAPACVGTNETTANLVRSVSTTTTLTINATIVSGDSISYQCLGY